MIEMLIAMKIVNRKRNVKRVKRHTSFINRIFGRNDENFIDFCRIEYGNDWQWAYSTFKREGKFPNSIDRKAA